VPHATGHELRDRGRHPARGFAGCNEHEIAGQCVFEIASRVLLTNEARRVDGRNGGMEDSETVFAKSGEEICQWR
jgi:hypothetical protein